MELEIDDPDDRRPAQLVAFAAFSAQIEQTLTPAAAREFADHIERLLDDSGYKGIHEPLDPFKAFRVGTGIAIKSVLDRKRVVPKDVARDLQRCCATPPTGQRQNKEKPPRLASRRLYTYRKRSGENG